MDLELMKYENHKETRRETAGESVVTIDWEIPLNQTNGNYRIVYYGDRMTQERNIVAFNGTSSTFLVEN